MLTKMKYQNMIFHLAVLIPILAHVSFSSAAAGVSIPDEPVVSEEAKAALESCLTCLQNNPKYNFFALDLSKLTSPPWKPAEKAPGYEIKAAAMVLIRNIVCEEISNSITIPAARERFTNFMKDFGNSLSFHDTFELKESEWAGFRPTLLRRFTTAADKNLNTTDERRVRQKMYETLTTEEILALFNLSEFVESFWEKTIDAAEVLNDNPEAKEPLVEVLRNMRDSAPATKKRIDRLLSGFRESKLLEN